MHVRSWCACAVVCLAFVPSSRAAEGPPPPAPRWTQVPPVDSPLARALVPEGLATLKVDPRTAAAFGELLGLLTSPEAREARLGPPTHAGRPDRVEWDLDGSEVMVEPKAALTLVRIDPDRRRPFPAALSALPLLAGVTKPCDEAVAGLGRPTLVDGSARVFVFRAGDQNAALELRCDDDRVERLTLVSAPRAAPPEPAARPARSTGKRFEGVPFASERGPKPLANPWPFGLGADPTWADLVARWGQPRIVVVGGGFLWGSGLKVRQSDTALVAEVEVGLGDLPWLVATRTPGREVKWIEGPRAVIEAALGPPTIATGDAVTWLYRSPEELVSLTATLTEGDLVSRLLWKRWPGEQKSLTLCYVDVLAPQPTQRGATHVFGSTEPGVVASLLRPWGITSVRDAFRVLGPPKSCGMVLEYPGLTFTWFGGHPSLRITADAKPFLASRGLDTTLADLAALDEESLRARLGGTETYGLPAARDDVSTLSVILLEKSTPPELFLSWSAAKPLNSLVSGLDVFSLLPSVARQLGVEHVGQPGVQVVTGYETKLVVTAPGVAWLAAHGIGGKAIDVLGRPWDAVIAALGEPSSGQLDPKKEALLLVWEDSRASIELRCPGTTPTCDQLTITGRNDGVRLD